MPLEPERRDFVRVAVEIPVAYRFSPSAEAPDASAEPMRGSTTNLSGGGLLLMGRLPTMHVVTELLTGKKLVSVSMTFPGDPQPILGRGRVAWVETVEEATLRCHLGVRFVEITPEDKERIFRYVIRVQMPV